MKKTLAIACAILVTPGCAIQRASVANDAQNQMVGLSKEQVMSCMGAPAQRNAEGATEVWTYNSGNGHTEVSTFSSTNASVTGTPYSATGSAFGSGFGVASTRYCVVSIVMSGGRVSRVNYSGPTGGLISAGEQCAFAVSNCVRS